MSRHPITATRVADESPRIEPVKIDYDTTNEQIIIAAGLVDMGARKKLARLFPEPKSFGHKLHQTLWGAVLSMNLHGLAYDPATVQWYADGEAADYAIELVEARPNIPPNLDHHIDLLQWDLRRLNASSGALPELIQQVRSPHSSREKIRALARQVADSFDSPNGMSAYYDSVELLRSQKADLRARRNGRALHPYGIPDLDRYEDGSPRLIPGAAPKRVTLVTGVSGSGKSTLVGRIALGFIEQGKTIAYGAWEVNAGATLELLATMNLNMSRSLVKTGSYDDTELAELENEMDRISTMIRFIRLPPLEPNQPRKNQNSVERICDWAEDAECDVFIADLLRKGFMSFDPDAEELALNYIQRRADNANYHSIFVQQQRLKDVESRKDKRPTREGVKGSSAWVEIADTIIANHRDALWKDIEDRTMELDILKQRDGKWPLAVQFDWEPDFGRLSNGRSVKYEITLDQEMSGVDSVFGSRKRRGHGRS